jgi:hypothetical protein
MEGTSYPLEHTWEIPQVVLHIEGILNLKEPLRWVGHQDLETENEKRQQGEKGFMGETNYTQNMDQAGDRDRG